MGTGEGGIQIRRVGSPHPFSSSDAMYATHTAFANQAAFLTEPERMHLVQARIFFAAPPCAARTV